MHKRYSLFGLILMAGLVSACLLSTGYQKKGLSYVYATWDESQGYVEHPILISDTRSFEVFDRHGYARDDQNVYYHEKTIQDADPGSFTALSDLYGKDKAQVYYAGRTIPGADPASFMHFDIQWGRDLQDVYFQDRPVGACDPATFVLLEEDWQRDSQCVYRQGKILSNADPASFVVLNYWFGKDRNQAYSHLGSILEGADAATFKLREGMCLVCAEDKNGCYRYDERVACEPLE